MDKNGKGLCAQHAAMKTKQQSRKTLAAAERDLLEDVLRTGKVDRSLWMIVTTLRADVARWAKEKNDG